MSKSSKKTICCPFCKKPIPFEHFSSVNVSVDPDLKQRVLDGSLFTLACPYCSKKTAINSPWLYHDMNKRFLIQVCFTEEDAKHFKLNQEESKFMPMMAKDGYKFRIVVGNNALKELVLIYDSGLNDIVINILKYILVNQDGDIQKIYFSELATKIDQIFFAAFSKSTGKKRMMSIPTSTYTQIEKRFLSYAQFDHNSFVYIGEDFVYNVLLTEKNDSDKHQEKKNISFTKNPTEYNSPKPTSIKTNTSKQSIGFSGIADISNKQECEKAVLPNQQPISNQNSTGNLPNRIVDETPKTGTNSSNNNRGCLSIILFLPLIITLIIISLHLFH